ncbi:MAG: pyridoxal phosphate-dependent decarboxylase family protein [Bacillota bacterium]
MENEGAMLEKGVSRNQVIEELTSFTGNDVDWRTGKVLTGLYNPGEDAHELAVEAYTRFLAQNALYVNMYPSIGKLEKDVVTSVAKLLRAGDDVAGNMTSGGTESILMAVKTARDWARENRPQVKEPEMVLPVSAHPAFLKAAHYFGLKVKQTGLDLSDYRADIDSFINALSSNTIIAIGSAPNFSHGSIDPIEEMAAIAAERDILFHVDGCVGGIYLSVMRRMGEDVPPFDFSLAGVTSISADLHKYGYTPKNASVILYRNRDLRKYAWFVCSSTTEYIVINPTAQSTRTGGPVAAAWAIMRYLGEEGFRDIVYQSQEATKKIIDGVKKIEEIEVLGRPDMCMFTLASDRVNVFEVDDEMGQRGWKMVPQFACGGSPPNLHVSLTRANIPHTDRFIRDLEEVVEKLRREGSKVNSAELEAVVQEVKDSPLEEVMAAIIPHIGLQGMELPERMAPLNTVLNLLPADKRDELLTMFFNMG